VAAGDLIIVTATCGAKVPLGGAFTAAASLGTPVGTFMVEESSYNNTGDGWDVKWRNTSSSSEEGTFVARAICADVAP
jgi:hypothetical protein